MHEEPKKSTQGYYVFTRERNFIWWLAWRNWMRDEIGQHFLPETLQGFTQFPPETQEAADMYAEYIRKIREKVKTPIPVPEHPRPWRRWTPTEMNRLEAEEMEARNPPRRRSQAEVDAVTASARRKYPRAFGRYRAPEEMEARQPLAFEESDPAHLDEMRSRLASKLPHPTDEAAE